MKVLHLIPDLGLGGAQRFLCYLAAAMDRKNYHLYVAYWGEADVLRKELEGLGVEVARLEGVDHSLFRLALAFGRHVRDVRPDIIHTHLFDADVIGIVAGRAMGVRRCCATVHSTTFFESRRHRWRYRALAVLATRFFAVSNAIGEALIRRCHVPASRVRVIRNGIDPEQFTPPARRERTAGTGPVIGTLARLDPRKGISVLIQAMAILLPTLPDALLIIGGAGEEQGALERQVQALGIARRVVFAGSVHEPRDFYRRLDVFILPSLDEGFGLVAVEAMAMGLPVIGTRVGGIPEILTHDRNGLLVEPGDADGIANSICALWADPALRSRLAEGARQTAVRFDIARTAAQLQAEYERLA
jgi:glycosyltransferase involved in cell wall biosynthesis